MDKRGQLIRFPLAHTAPDADAFLAAVLTGWKNQQLAQNLSAGTIGRRARSVLRMASSSGKFPWEWLPGDADDFFAHLRGVQNLSHNSVRAYQTDVKLFLEFAGDPIYDWNERCGQLFGTVFSQVVTDRSSRRSHHPQRQQLPAQRHQHDTSQRKTRKPGTLTTTIVA